MRGSLTNDEWDELVALEYVLTWGYSEEGEKEKDSTRHRELSDKNWISTDPDRYNKYYSNKT